MPIKNEFSSDDQADPSEPDDWKLTKDNIKDAMGYFEKLSKEFGKAMRETKDNEVAKMWGSGETEIFTERELEDIKIKTKNERHYGAKE